MDIFGCWPCEIQFVVYFCVWYAIDVVTRVQTACVKSDHIAFVYGTICVCAIEASSSCVES